MKKKRINLGSMQKYNSACTSINAGHKVPVASRIAGMLGEPGDWVLDYGGGRYDSATEYLATVGMTNVIYDPYNRGEEENLRALNKTDYQLATLSNVLNVIMEERIHHYILQDIKDHLCTEGTLIVKIYEGDRSGKIKVDEKRNSCQLNLKTEQYLPEVEKVFGGDNVKQCRMRGTSVILAKKKD